MAIAASSRISRGDDPRSQPVHLRTTSRARQSVVPDFVHSAPRTTVLVPIGIHEPTDEPTTPAHAPMHQRARNDHDVMIAIDVLRWPGVNQAFLVVVHRARSCCRSRSSRTASAARSMRRSTGARRCSRVDLHLRRAVPRVRRRAPPVDQPRRQEPRLVAGQAAVGWGGFLKPRVAGRLEPDHAPVRSGARHRRRAAPRRVLRCLHLPRHLVAEAWRRQAEGTAGVHVRPSAGEEGIGPPWRRPTPTPR